MIDIEQDTVIAVTDMVGRTGARDFQVRYHDDPKPVVWLCVATYEGGRFEAAAATTPGKAAWRLAEQLLDGAQCTHCKRPVALLKPEEEGLTTIVPAEMQTFCEYVLRGKTIIRGCQR